MSEPTPPTAPNSSNRSTPSTPSTLSTVGELLTTAEFAALRLIGDTEPNDALPLAAGWAAVLDAAAEVLAAIPQPAVGDAPRGGTAGYLSIRLQRIAAQAHRRPPIDIQPHPTTARVTETLQQAAGLLNRQGHPGLVTNPETRADASAAEVKVARTVAALAHVTGGELRAYARLVTELDRRTSGTPSPARALSATAVTRWVAMVQSHEQHTLDYVTTHLGDLDSERPGPAGPGNAFGVAVAAWTRQSIQATADPHVAGADLQHIAHAQNALLKTAGLLTMAAVERGELGTDTGRHLHRRLHTAAASWATVGDLWGWAQTPDANRAAPDTITASTALHVALVDATRSGPTWASPLDVGQRLNGTAILPLVAAIVQDSAELADIYQELPEELHHAGRLRAPAGILRQMAIEHADQTRSGPPAVGAPAPRAPVRLIDVASQRLQPLTPLALDRMCTETALLMVTAQRAQQALHSGGPFKPSTPGPTPATPQPQPLAVSRSPHHHPPRQPPSTAITP